MSEKYEPECTCHCGGSMFYRHLHAESCPCFTHGTPAPPTELDTLRHRCEALEQERDWLVKGTCPTETHIALVAALRVQVEALERERDEWKARWDMRGKALARPCMQCGYKQAEIKAAVPSAPPTKGEQDV